MVMALVATTLTTSLSWTIAPALSEATLHLTVPLAPTAGVEQVTPVGGVSDWNCVNDGSGSLTTMPVPADGPAFFSVTVYVSMAFGPVLIGLGVAPTETPRSASATPVPDSATVLVPPSLAIVSVPD